MMLTASGHLKYVDFGTAKDMVETDFNGPEFVGTPEYMSPTVVSGKASGPEGDLWSLGVVLFQMFTGYTAFQAPSPYLSFIRIKRALVKVPGCVPHLAQDLIRLLLEKDGDQRLENAIGARAQGPTGDAGLQINYDRLRGHDFFKTCGDERLRKLQGFANLTETHAVRVPSLRDLAMRAVGQTAVTVASHIAQNGGVRPKIAWIEVR
jgi:serine/threonine protein kinase